MRTLILLACLMVPVLAGSAARFDLSPDGLVVASLLPGPRAQSQLWTYQPDSDRVHQLLTILEGYRGRVAWAGPRRLLLVVEQAVDEGFRVSGIYRIDVNDGGLPLAVVGSRSLAPRPGQIAVAGETAAKGVRLASATDFLKPLYDPAGAVSLVTILPLPADPARAIVQLGRGDEVLLWELTLAAGYHRELIDDPGPLLAVTAESAGERIFVQFDDEDRRIAAIDAGDVIPIATDDSLRLVGFDDEHGRLLVQRNTPQGSALLRLDPRTGDLTDPLFETTAPRIDLWVDDTSGQALRIEAATTSLFLSPAVREAQLTMEQSLPGQRHRMLDTDTDRRRFVIASVDEAGTHYHLLRTEPPRLQLLFRGPAEQP